VITEVYENEKEDINTEKDFNYMRNLYYSKRDRGSSGHKNNKR